MPEPKPAIVAILIAACCGNVPAIDLLPGEVRAPTPDTTTIQVIAQKSTFDDAYSHGHRVRGAPALESTQYRARLGHSFELGTHPFHAYVDLPYANVRASGSPAASGAGDIALALACWPYADRASGTYFAVAGYLVFPTGSYDAAHSLNIGENRFRSALQAGFHTSLRPGLQWMLAFDTVWHGTNDGFGPRRTTLERKPLYTAQTALMLELDPAFTVAAGYFQTFGGQTSAGGIWRDDSMRSQRYQLSGIANLPFGRLVLQYGADLETHSGYAEDSRWTVRYLQRF